jgi:hypothetical protein
VGICTYPVQLKLDIAHACLKYDRVAFVHGGGKARDDLDCLRHKSNLVISLHQPCITYPRAFCSPLSFSLITPCSAC